jgi:hypothetical protein
MDSIEELQRKRLVTKISQDIAKYGAHMNKYENEPMYPEKQISDVIDYLRGEDCIKDIDITCEDGNITKDGILNVKLNILLKPETPKTIIQNIK